MSRLRAPYVDDNGFPAIVAQLPEDLRGATLHQPALYAVQFLGSKLIKVGRSMNLRSRMREHILKHGRLRILFIVPDAGEREREVLQACRPYATPRPGNLSGKRYRTEYHRPVPGMIQALDRAYRRLSPRALPGCALVSPHLGA